jgi:hypothetical protein
MFRVWKGPGEPHDSDEEWGAATKIQAHMPAKVMDDGVQVAQMLDDLFVPRDVEDLVAEAAELTQVMLKPQLWKLLELKQAQEWMV